MAKVNIIIINYNNFKDTIECLESVLRLKYYSYQVILVDNNSENDSFSILQNWARQRGSFVSYYFDGTKYVEREKCVLLEKDSSGGVELSCYPIIFIQTHDNLGFSGGNNVGIQFSLDYGEPEYFWFLNNDTVIDNEALSALVKTSNSDKNIGVVGSKILYYDLPKKIQCLGGYDIKYGYAQSRYDGRQDFGVGDFEVKGYIN
ncbi:MAG: glycosyltransferase, partial [Candidatus Omnitrophota bacterium]